MFTTRGEFTIISLDKYVKNGSITCMYRGGGGGGVWGGYYRDQCMYMFADFDSPFLGPLDLLPWRVVGRSVSVCLSVCLSTPVTRQPMFGFFSKSVGIFLG